MKKTTHQVAKELLEMPDIPLCVEGWYGGKDYELQVEICQWAEENDPQAILVNTNLYPIDYSDSPSPFETVWVNIPVNGISLEDFKNG